MTYCDICMGSKAISLAVIPQSEASPSYDMKDDETVRDFVEAGSRDFPCPQCQPLVPFKRVRSMKVVTAYPAGEFGRLQVPIERSLAARFGEYLMREGLIKFTTRGSADMGVPEKKITITAHLGVVSREDTLRAGAVEEVATTAASKPQLAERLRRKGRFSPNAVKWEVPGVAEEITDEFDEPRGALGSRFAGLDFA